MRPKIVFLHSELAQYFLACLKCLAERAEITVFHWPINPEAPFKFKNLKEIKLVEKSDNNQLDIIDRLNEINPDIIVISGWRDKDYIKAIRGLTNKPRVVLALDNPWNGKLKQRIWAAYFKVFLKGFFTHCWIPGNLQASYAKKLGFKEDELLKNLYSCDATHFHAIYNNRLRKESRPNRFLYVGRYSKEKGIFSLWQAFIELVDEKKMKWELWCMGTGPEFENRILHPQIKHFGFVQPEDMDELIKNVDVFVLPSTYEPWGLVVHEMVCAGMPLITSDKVGATEKFLVNDQNGCIFNANSGQDLKKNLQKISEKTDNEIVAMSKFSYELSFQVTPSTWRAALLEIL